MIYKVFFLSIFLFITGCTSVVTTSQTEGIPYYLPKPYILITRNIPLIDIQEDSKVFNIKKNQDIISFKIIYLPDLKEKHRLFIKSGTGSIDTNITLTDGWKLTGINLKADSETSEIIEAIGNIIQQIPVKTSEEKRAEIWLYEMVIEDGKVSFEQVFYQAF